MTTNSPRPRRRRYSLRWGDVPSSVAPYVPTPINIVVKMLDWAQAEADDIVYDLGCGDGRILFTAVEEFDVKKAVGFELNTSMYESVLRKVEKKGLHGRVKVVNKNFFLADLSGASLVTLYLTTSGNSKLRPKLEEELTKGARVVSHDFPVQGWKTLRPDSPEHFVQGSHRIYLYRVPEAYAKSEIIAEKPMRSNRWRRFREVFLRSGDGH